MARSLPAWEPVSVVEGPQRNRCAGPGTLTSDEGHFHDHQGPRTGAHWTELVKGGAMARLGAYALGLGLVFAASLALGNAIGG